MGKEHGVILSTHILPEVQESCTWVQIIHKGALVLNDSIEGLEQQMQASSLLLVVEGSAEASELEAVEGVRKVAALGEGRWRIFHDRDQSPSNAMARKVLDRGWGLRELTPERRSMEQIFIDITQGVESQERHP